jgi:hypothetical protein
MEAFEGLQSLENTIIVVIIIIIIIEIVIAQFVG